MLLAISCFDKYEPSNFMNQSLAQFQRLYEAQGIILQLMADEQEEFTASYKMLRRILAHLDKEAGL